MKALKFTVFFLGGLIFVALGLLIYGMTTRLSTTEPVGMGTVAVKLPPDCRLAQAEATDDQILLRLEGPPDQGCEKVLVFSSSDGRKLGEFVAEKE